MVKEFNDLVDKAKIDIANKRGALNKQKTTQDFVNAVKAGMGFKQTAKAIKESYDAIDKTKFIQEQRTHLKNKFSLKEAEIVVFKSNYVASLLESLAGQFDSLEKALREKVDLVQADPEITEWVNSFVDSVNKIMNGVYSAEGKIEQTNQDTANVLQQAEAVAKGMANIAPVIRKAYNAGLISYDQLSKVIGKIEEERTKFVDGYNKNIIAGERLTLEPLTKGLSTEFAELINEQLEGLRGSIQGIEKNPEKVIGFRAAFKKIEKGFGGLTVGLTEEENKELTKEFSKSKKDIAELKVDYITNLLNFLHKKYLDMAEKKTVGEPLVRWVEEVNTLVVDKAFYEGIDKKKMDPDTVFLSKKESKMVDTDTLFEQARRVHLSMRGMDAQLKKESHKFKVQRLRQGFATQYNKNIPGKKLE